jgi:hypothetical protein
MFLGPRTAHDETVEETADPYSGLYRMLTLAGIYTN